MSPMDPDDAARLAPIALGVIMAISIGGWMLKNAVVYQMVCMEPYLVKDVQAEEEVHETEEVYEEKVYEEIEEDVLQQNPTLATKIARAAYTQAQWHYEYGTEPTRKVLGGKGMSQPMWNSGRDVLKVMGLIEEEAWAELGWEQVNTLFGRIQPAEDENRMWVPLASGRGMKSVGISTVLTNNRYTAPPREQL